jgi:hypothetical protein
MFREQETDKTHPQYNDNVIGAGSPHYDNAYFTINFVRVYTVEGLSSSISNSLHRTSTSTNTNTNTGGTRNPTSTGSVSGSGSNDGIVLTFSSSLQLFLLCLVGVLAVFA